MKYQHSKSGDGGLVLHQDGGAQGVTVNEFDYKIVWGDTKIEDKVDWKETQSFTISMCIHKNGSNSKSTNHYHVKMPSIEHYLDCLLCVSEVEAHTTVKGFNSFSLLSHAMLAAPVQ